MILGFFFQVAPINFVTPQSQYNGFKDVKYYTERHLLENVARFPPKTQLQVCPGVPPLDGGTISKGNWNNFTTAEQKT